MSLARGLDLQIRDAFGVSELIGVDEAGRGPLAGPVMAAAVLLGPEPLPELRGVRDSKVLLEKEREALYGPIMRRAKRVAVGWAQPTSIDKVNILVATLHAMRRCVRRLGCDALVLVDGNCYIPRLGQRQMTIVDGDAKSLAIACASVIAKVTRDRLMREFCARLPEYCFGQHKGYGTELHLVKLHEHGPCPIHRRSFEPVAQPLLALELVSCRAESRHL